MSKTKKKSTFLTVLKYILVVLLLLGAVGLVIRFVSCDEDISGMYVKYGDMTITSDNDGIVIEHDGSNTATFTICNNDGWGDYTVKDCTVKVIQNVDSENDFDFIVGSNNYVFSSETDLTAAFVLDSNYSGNGISVNDDGSFEVSLSNCSMSQILAACYGKTVTLDNEIYLNEDIYFAIQITSPDESETITIPFTYNFIPVEWIELSDSKIYL